MNAEPSKRSLTVGWGFWLWWMLAGAAAWGIGGPVGMAVGSFGDIVVAGFMGLAVGGIVVGVVQRVLLRPRVGGMDRWGLANLLAVAVVGTVVFGVGAVDADVGWVAGALLFGPVVGVLQWLLLRGQVDRAGWWVVASAVGWVAGGPGVGFLSWLVGGPVEGLLGEFLGWGALGTVYAAITGTVLVWLLRQRPLGTDQSST